MRTNPDQFPNRIQRTSQLTQEDIAELNSMSEADLIKHGYKSDPNKKPNPESDALLRKWAGGDPKPPF